MSSESRHYHTHTRRPPITAKKFTCHLCKRTRPEEKMNVEAVIHHNAQYFVCYDHLDCRRFQRRLKQRENRKR